MELHYLTPKELHDLTPIELEFVRNIEAQIGSMTAQHCFKLLLLDMSLVSVSLSFFGDMGEAMDYLMDVGYQG